MSYEGYIQVICKLGHCEEWDCMDYEGDIDARCCICGSSLAWVNHVDTTNGGGDSGFGEGYIKLEESTQAIVDKCEHCGHWTSKAAAEYKIPEEGGTIL